MYRYLSLLSVLGASLLTLSLAACGDNGGGDGGGDDGNNNTPDAGDNNTPDAGDDTPDAAPAETCDVCVEEAACDDSSDTAVCTCPKGFSGDGRVDGTGCTADLVDECAAGTDDCGEALCRDEEVGFSCLQIVASSASSGEIMLLNPDAFVEGRVDNPETDRACDGDGIVAHFDVTEDGNPDLDITGIQALTAKPETGEIFVIYTDAADDTQRILGTLVPNTGVITRIGVTGDRVSSLTFDDEGNLFATTGDGATTSETMWLVDQATAALTLVTDVPNGADGTIIGFNPVDGHIYHLSSNGEQVYDLVQVTIDDTDPMNLVIDATKTTVTHSGFLHNEAFGLIPNWPTADTLGMATIDGELLELTFDVTDIMAPTVDAVQFESANTDSDCSPGPSLNTDPDVIRGLALTTSILVPKADGDACTADFECDGVCDLLGSNTCEPDNTCGNGLIEGVEICDDGNTDDGDGCAADCGVVLLADGEACGIDYECENVCDSLGSNTCEPADTCGNGNLETGEDCDDGNVDDGDGCSAACAIE